MEFKRIVSAFDRSNDSVKATGMAADLASKFGAELIVVHVYTYPAWLFASYAGTPAPNIAEIQSAAKEGAHELLAEGVRVSAEHGVKARGELIEAPSVVQALVEFTTNEKADLVVVGSRGMTGFKKVVLGSVSSGLVTHAGCPVLVVR